MLQKQTPLKQNEGNSIRRPPTYCKLQLDIKQI